MEPWSFALDNLVVISVASDAGLGTRRAARILQTGLRERLGLDPPIVRIAERGKARPGTKEIWIVEPATHRSPARTIGIEHLTFSPPMLGDGYFIRVDAIETVLHGATDAGSCHAAETLLQMIQPGRRGSLFRAARPPSIPCLWAADWPAQAVRSLPAGCPVPPASDAAAAFLAAAARYKLNAVPRDSLPTDSAAFARLQELASRCSVRVVDAPPVLPAGPLGEVAHLWLRRGDAAAYGLAALGEATWAEGPLSPAEFRLRFARITFHADAAAEAIALTEECLAAPAPRTPQDISRQALALADLTGDDAARVAQQRKAHDRRGARVRQLWGGVHASPALRDAFRELADVEISLWDATYALADARRLCAAASGTGGLTARVLSSAARGLRKQAARIVAQTPALRQAKAVPPLDEALRLLEAIAGRLDAAAAATPPPSLDEIWKNCTGPGSFMRATIGQDSNG